MKTKNILAKLLGAASIFMISCSQDDITSNDQAILDNSSSSNRDNLIHTCLDMESNLPQDKSNFVSLNSSQWENGQTIRVKFLNGPIDLQNKVKEYAQIWTQYANLKFQFVSAYEQADIRINFDDSRSSWSYIGINNKYIDQNSQTMNFGWFFGSLDEEIKRTTLHEFGHALGLLHEHQSPAGGINWNKDRAYAYYATMGFTKESVDSNMFAKYTSDQTNYSQFDLYSIMLYPIDASLTLDGWSSPKNLDLSGTDKQYITSMYPGLNDNGGGDNGGGDNGGGPITFPDW